MEHIIDHVASLIDVRDRDDLEFTLAGVMFELVAASALTLWHARRRNGVVAFEKRVRLALDAEPSADEGYVGLDSLSEVARLAFAKRRFCARVDAGGEFGCYAAPVADGAEVVALVEIISAPPLDAAKERLMSGLIRIYRSHLGILDHSDIDELTGLANRRAFNETFGRLAPKSRSQALLPPCPSKFGRAELAVVDVDHFKRVNDTFGHIYGDEVLVLLAQLMRSSFQDPDRVFRFGGEEFVVLLCDVDSQAADEALERFRSAVAAHVFPQVGKVTVSLGVTTVLDGETGSDAFGRADEALYQAKRSGRNRLLRTERLVETGEIAPKPKRSADVEMF